MKLMKPIFLPLMLFWALMATGCRWSWLTGDLSVPPSEPAPALVEKYQTAIASFENAAYGEAAEKFEAVKSQAGTTNLGRKALFGLACARLMAAETPAAYRQALALWDSWVAGAPRDWDRENPLLLVPLVKEKLLVANIPLAPDPGEDAAQDTSKLVPQWLLVSTNAELNKYKQRVAEGERLSQQDQKKIAALEREIQKLKEQIKALETIDQKIQKKKNAIPSAD